MIVWISPSNDGYKMWRSTYIFAGVLKDYCLRRRSGTRILTTVVTGFSSGWNNRVREQGQGEGVLISCIAILYKTTDPRISTMSGRSTSGFHRPRQKSRVPSAKRTRSGFSAPRAPALKINAKLWSSGPSGLNLCYIRYTRTLEKHYLLFMLYMCYRAWPPSSRASAMRALR